MFVVADLPQSTRRAKVRQTLVDDPQWKQYNEIKQTIRTESKNTIAEALKPVGNHR